ncbi:MAG: hypothetical protein WBE04_03515 [Methyloceanibacter sp.]
MPERGSVQFLLLFFRSRVRAGCRIGVAVAFIALLGLLPGEQGMYNKAKTGFDQSLREAAWKSALAGESKQTAWPWDEAAPAANRAVPRLGLSAALYYESGAARPDQDSLSRARSSFAADDARDPHLARGDVAIGDRITVTTANGDTQVYTVTGAEPVDAVPTGAAAAAAAPDSCAPLDTSLAGALRLIIEAIRVDAPSSPTASEEQKL